MTPDNPGNPPMTPPPTLGAERRGWPGGRSLLLTGLLFLVLLGGIVGVFFLGGRVAEQSTPGLVFTIPAGQTVARPGFDSAIAIPTDIRFSSPAEAVITVKNLDSVTQRAGPFLVGAGQTFTQRFPEPGRYPIICSVDPLETVVVTVEG